MKRPWIAQTLSLQKWLYILSKFRNIILISIFFCLICTNIIPCCCSVVSFSCWLLLFSPINFWKSIPLCSFFRSFVLASFRIKQNRLAQVARTHPWLEKDLSLYLLSVEAFIPLRMDSSKIWSEQLGTQ